MDYQALEKSLERQVISPVYLFYGEETYLREKYIDRFKALIPQEVRDFNLDIIDGRLTALEDILTSAVTLPFMTDRRIVIVKNADYFKSRRKNKNEDGAQVVDPVKKSDHANESDKEEKADAGDEALLNYLESPPDTTCLVFCTDSVDKKRKVYKTIEKKGQVIEFAPLKGRELNEWINRQARGHGKIIEPAAIAGLIAAIGNDLQQLSTELEKLACYSETERISADDIEAMVSKTAELSIFELVDAIGDRNYKKAIRMAREMVFFGEPVIRIIFMIARQFRLILQAKSLMEQGYIEKHVSEALKVHPFVARKCIRQAGNFTIDESVAAMEKILETDARIKSGRQEAVLALELLIISLCEKLKNNHP